MIWGLGDRVAAMDRALTGVETLLRSGQLGQLPEAMVALERAMQGLREGDADRLDASHLSKLRARADHVGTLLQAVLAGMRDARATLAAPVGFSSYDAAGRSGQIGGARSRLERRR